MTPPACFHLLTRAESWVRRPSVAVGLVLLAAWAGMAVGSCVGSCGRTGPDAVQGPSYDPGEEGGDSNPCDGDPINGGPC